MPIDQRGVLWGVAHNPIEVENLGDMCLLSCVASIIDMSGQKMGNGIVQTHR